MFYYRPEDFRSLLLRLPDKQIEFQKLLVSNWNGRRMTHQVEVRQAWAFEEPLSSCVLSLDCDLHFHDGPFKIFLDNRVRDFLHEPHSGCASKHKSSGG